MARIPLHACRPPIFLPSHWKVAVFLCIRSINHAAICLRSGLWACNSKRYRFQITNYKAPSCIWSNCIYSIYRLRQCDEWLVAIKYNVHFFNKHFNYLNTNLEYQIAIFNCVGFIYYLWCVCGILLGWYWINAKFLVFYQTPQLVKLSAHSWVCNYA